MRYSIALFVACLCFSSQSASAQVFEGDARLFLDTTFISWSSDRVKAETAAGADFKETHNTTSLGIVGGGGVGGGYALRSWLIPELYFSLHHAKTRNKVRVDGDEVSESDSSSRTWELRPMVEFPFLPEGRIVPFAAAGLSLGRSVWEAGAADGSRFMYGPYFGGGVHGFVPKGISFDFGLGFRTLFVKDDDREDGYENTGMDDVRQRQLDLMVTFGVSFWL